MPSSLFMRASIRARSSRVNSRRSILGVLLLFGLIASLISVDQDALAHSGSPSPYLERSQNGDVTYGNPSLQVSGGTIDFDLSWSPCEVAWNEPIEVRIFGVDQYGVPTWESGLLGYYDLGGNCGEAQPMHISKTPESWWDPGIMSSDVHEIRYIGYSGKIYLRSRDVDVSCTQTTDTRRISVGLNDRESNHSSFSDYSFTMSEDGRIATFYSYASNLSPEDTDTTKDVYVYDLDSDTTELISKSTGGVKGNSHSMYPSVSPDGRYIVFESSANNLVSNDTNGKSDIFIHDRQTGGTTLISVTSDGLQANDHSLTASVSSDGERVVFDSAATNLVPGDGNGRSDVFVRDIDSGTTERISVSASGNEGNAASFWSHISADGGHVAYISYATNLVAGDTGGAHVFVRDLTTGTTVRASVASDGTEANSSSDEPMLSGDGRYVVFESWASNLTGGASGSNAGLFVRDLKDSVTEAIPLSKVDGGSAGGYEPSISVGGRYVAFETPDPLASGDNNNRSDVYVYDRQTLSTTRSSVGTQGQDTNQSSWYPFISGDGTRVQYGSPASNLVCGDDAYQDDMFVSATGVPEPDSSDGDGDATECDLNDTNCEYQDDEECEGSEECLAEGEHPCAAPEVYCGEIVPPPLVPSPQPSSEPSPGSEASTEISAEAPSVEATPTPSPTELPDCRDVGKFCLTAVGQVLSVSVNIKMAHCGDDRSCSGSGEASVATRQTRFAKRIVEMARKELGAGEIPDGMAYLPDVILLQEAWKYDDGKNDVRGIKAALKQITGGIEGVDYGVAIQQERCRPRKSKRCRAQKVVSSDGDLTSKRKFKGATAILYNKWTMKKNGSPGRIASRWSPFMDVDSHLPDGDAGEELILCKETERQQRFPELLVDLNADGLLDAYDLDGDGEHDCKAASQRRQVYAGFVEKDDTNLATDPLFVAAASVHMILDADLSEAANAADVPEDLKAMWSEKIADRLVNRYGSDSPDAYVIGGDFNQQRCPYQEEEGTTESTPPHESVPCTLEDSDPYADEGRTEAGEKDFWKSLVNSKGYADTVYAMHSVPDEIDETATESMTKQYRDGTSGAIELSRKKRIDLIFASLSDRAILAASHDLTCGEDLDSDPAKRGNCQSKAASERYSDHRLVWTLVGMTLPQPAPTPTPSPIPLPSPSVSI